MLWSLLAGLVLVSGWAGPAAAGPEEAGEPYLLGVGDVVEVSVWNEKELSRTLQVRLDGRISLPLIGDLAAAGLAPAELAAEIEKGYRKTLAAPAVTVMLKQSNRRYYVIGQVKQPGEFGLDSPLTVLRALARSGGFLEWAKTGNIVVVRKTAAGEELIPFNYDAVTKRGDGGQQMYLTPGDTIVVP